MDRRKLEYMIKNFSTSAKDEVLQHFDINGIYEFHSLARDFLLNPDTKDIYTLSFIPANYKPINIENTKLKYTLIFTRINEIFIENNAFPVFDNPKDLTKSELTRRDIIKKQSEKVLNNYFGVDSFYNYNPPEYKPNKNS